MLTVAKNKNKLVKVTFEKKVNVCFDSLCKTHHKLNTQNRIQNKKHHKKV